MENSNWDLHSLLFFVMINKIVVIVLQKKCIMALWQRGRFKYIFKNKLIFLFQTLGNNTRRMKMNFFRSEIYFFSSTSLSGYLRAKLKYEKSECEEGTKKIKNRKDGNEFFSRVREKNSRKIPFSTVIYVYKSFKLCCIPKSEM